MLTPSDGGMCLGEEIKVAPEARGKELFQPAIPNEVKKSSQIGLN